MTDLTFTRTVARRVDPDRLIRGEPFVVLRPGVVRSYDGPELEGNVTDAAQLHEMVRYFEEVQRKSGEYPPIDIGHTATGPLAFMAHPEASIPLGAVIEMRVIEDEAGPGLEVTPAWTRRGREYVDAAEGLLHPSALYRLAPTGDRMSAEPKAGAALLAFAVTPTPATRVDQLGAVRSYDSAGVVPPARPHAESTAPTPAAVPAIAEEAPRMGMPEILAAFSAMSPEEKAALLKELAPAPADPPTEPPRAAAPVADPVAEARSLAAEAFADSLVAREFIFPAQREVWARSYAADPEATKRNAPTAPVTRKPEGSAVPPKPSTEVPTERNAFVAFARGLGGGDLTKGLALAKVAHPAQHRAAFVAPPAPRKAVSL